MQRRTESHRYHQCNSCLGHNVSAPAYYQEDILKLTVVDPESDHDTSCDGHLLHADHSSTHFWWCTLCIVHRDDHGQRTNTHACVESVFTSSIIALDYRTCDKATSEDGVVTGASDRRSLDDYTKYKDTSVDQDGIFAGDDLCKETRVDRSQPGAELED